MNEEETNKKLLDDLKNLPKVQAPRNFETELWRKINSSETVKERSFLERFFSPGKLAQAAAVLASAVIIFFVIDGNSEVMEDPLNMEPRLRDDLVVLSVDDEIPTEIDTKSSGTKENLMNRKKTKSEVKDEIQTQTKPITPQVTSEDNFVEGEQSVPSTNELKSSEILQDSNIAESDNNLSGGVMPAPVSTSLQEISKDNLNFMQRNLSNQEKIEVEQLKERIQSQKSAKTKQNQSK